MVRQKRSGLIAVAVVLASLFVGGLARAAEKQPLPQSLVQTRDGAPVTLDQSTGPESRVFIYVLPGSAVSTRLIAALSAWQLAAPERVSIVVGGEKAAAAAFAAAEHGLPSGVQWLLDPDRTFWTDLQVTGVPTLFGVRNGLVEWRLAGVLNEPTALKGVITSWVSAAP